MAPANFMPFAPPGSPTLLAQSLTLTPVWSIMVLAFNAC
jgi:hypothetical protein